MTAKPLQKRPGLYTVQVTHAGGKRLTWMHMCASISEALAWARRRWPDATGFTAQALRARKPLAVFSSPRPRRALARTGGEGQGEGTLPQAAEPIAIGATAAFCGARRIKGGVPVFALPITSAPL